MLAPGDVLNLKFNIWDSTMYEFYLTNHNGSLDILLKSMSFLMIEI